MENSGELENGGELKNGGEVSGRDPNIKLIMRHIE
jgi:hypothetical protein